MWREECEYDSLSGRLGGGVVIIHDFNIYARNRGSRLWTVGNGYVPSATQPFRCPVCLAETLVKDGRVSFHMEHGGFTQCPASGSKPETAVRRAATMTADYLFPSESALRDE